MALNCIALLTFSAIFLLIQASHLKPLCKEDHLKMAHSSSTCLNSSSRNGSDPKVCRVTAPAKGGGEKQNSIGISDGGIHKALSTLNSRSKSAQEHPGVLNDLLFLTQTPRFDIEWAFASQEEKDLGKEIVANLQQHSNHDTNQLLLTKLSKKIIQ